jgi:hypothetical protein
MVSRSVYIGPVRAASLRPRPERHALPPTPPPNNCLPSLEMVIPGDYEPSVQTESLGVIFSAIAYGIVIVLSGNCFHLLQRKGGMHSNRVRILLLIYVTVMFLFSTWALVQWILSLMVLIDLRNIILQPYRTYLATQIPVTIWGADGFMVRVLIFRQGQIFTIKLQVWRCVVLYQDVSKGPRIAVIILLSLLSLASFGRSISIYSPGSHSYCS